MDGTIFGKCIFIRLYATAIFYGFYLTVYGANCPRLLFQPFCSNQISTKKVYNCLEKEENKKFCSVRTLFQAFKIGIEKIRNATTRKRRQITIKGNSPYIKFNSHYTHRRSRANVLRGCQQRVGFYTTFRAGYRPPATLN